MINPEIADLIDKQFETIRQMWLRKQTFMLRKDYVHNEAFLRESFKNIFDVLELLHETVGANYEVKK